jgi:hypothetical protein
VPKKKLQGPCAVPGCGVPIKTAGYCETHYHRLWKFGRLEKVNTGLKRKHPLYILWHERKQTGSLVPEWVDFWAFISGVGEKPSPNHLLVKITEGPYGPSNFKWVEPLRRKEGESRKDWYARKWSSQRELHPTRERKRDLYRAYGLSIEQYDEMAESQDNCCAICQKPEKAIDFKTGAPKRLSVDHCHKSGKIRELLCWRCNGTLGKVEDSPRLLQAMILYLRKHQ